MKLFLPLILFLATGVCALAQLDRDAEGCAETFGPAVSTGPLPEYQRYSRATYSTHEWEGYQVRLTMDRAVCVQITYRRPTRGAETFEKLTRAEMNRFLEQNSRGENWFSSATEVNFWFTPRAIAYYEPGLRQFTILTKTWATVVNATLADQERTGALPQAPWTDSIPQGQPKPSSP